MPFDESTTSTPPPAFGPYRVLHQIGSGVLGPVFRTYDPQSDRLVAVKSFRLDIVPEDVARLADGLRRLVGNTGTAGTIAAGLEGTTAYLAMDYHAAETLDVALRHLAPAPVETALPILRAMAEEIDRAWAAGTACGHGSLHPRDVFLTPGTSELRITGFGVGPALETIGVRPPVRRPYTAPERASNSAWDIRADVYSLGAIAHELLTGRRPAGPGEQDGALPSAMPPEQRVQIRRVLARALAESPLQRFASGAEFINALSDPASQPAFDFAPVAAPAEDAAHVPEEAPPTFADVAEPEVTAAEEPPVIAAGAPPTQAAPAPSAPVRARVRATQSVVNKKTPARTPPREPALVEDLVQIAAEPVVNISGAVPRPSDELQLTSDTNRTLSLSAPMALPPPVPLVPLAAVAVACLILGAVIDHQFFLPRTPAPAVATAPASTAMKSDAPIAAAPATSDTEVAVNDPAKAPNASDAKSGAAATPANPGKLVIRSSPEAASVTIDGKAAGRTPMTAPDLALGSHTVDVSRPGFAAETRRPILTSRVPAVTLQITLSLEKSASASKNGISGSVIVDSRPKGARVTIDGRVAGATPLSVPGLKPGSHAVRVELAGYKPVTTTVIVKAGETAKFAVTLEQR